MRTSFAALSAFGLLHAAAAHNVMGIFIVNDTATPAWKYVRDVGYLYSVTPSWDPKNEFPKTPPMTWDDIWSTDITCGRQAFASANKTQTADVVAGSEVGFRVSYDGNGPGGSFWHPGPGQAYLSRAPNDDLENYQGDGDWFKVAYAGPISNKDWSLYPNKPDWNFTIPRTTPPGKYLLRIEQFMPTNTFGYTQWYVNCAHLNIIGPGGGTPQGFAKFPGTYEVDDPGVFIPVNQGKMLGYVPEDELRLLEYKPPGPAVWAG